MPINKVYDKNGKPVKKDGKQKYRVRVNYTDSLGRNKQIERTAYGSDEAKHLHQSENPDTQVSGILLCIIHF